MKTNKRPVVICQRLKMRGTSFGNMYGYEEFRGVVISQHIDKNRQDQDKQKVWKKSGMTLTVHVC